MAALPVDIKPPYCSNQVEVSLSPIIDPAKIGNLNGVTLILYNAGSEACQMFATPQIAFEDGSGKLLPIKDSTYYVPMDRDNGISREGIELGRGFVKPRIVIPSGALASEAISWNFGDHHGSHCFETKAMSVNGVGALKGGELTLEASICGDFDNWAWFRQTSLKVHP